MILYNNFYIFLTSWFKFYRRDFLIIPMSNFGFRENGHNESRTFLKDVNNILPALSTFFVQFL